MVWIILPMNQTELQKWCTLQTNWSCDFNRLQIQTNDNQSGMKIKTFITISKGRLQNQAYKLYYFILENMLKLCHFDWWWGGGSKFKLGIK